MPKKQPATLSVIYHMPKEDLRPHPLTPYGVWDDPAMQLDYYVPGRNTPTYYAAMYLLTSNEIIYWRMANCFCRNGLDFRYAILRGITTYNYALYRAALALATGRQGVTVSELDDTELIGDDVFRLIINAMLIARYGMTAMNPTKEVNTNDG